MIHNPAYPIKGKCIWCLEEFTLKPNENWYTPYICPNPNCQKPLGHFELNHHYAINSYKEGEEQVPEYAEVWDHIFNVELRTYQLIPFMKVVCKNEGRIKEVAQFDKSHWMLVVRLSKAIEFPNVKFENPPLLVLT